MYVVMSYKSIDTSVFRYLLPKMGTRSDWVALELFLRIFVQRYTSRSGEWEYNFASNSKTTQWIGIIKRILFLMNEKQRIQQVIEMLKMKSLFISRPVIYLRQNGQMVISGDLIFVSKQRRLTNNPLHITL